MRERAEARALGVARRRDADHDAHLPDAVLHDDLLDVDGHGRRLRRERVGLVFAPHDVERDGGEREAQLEVLWHRDRHPRRQVHAPLAVGQHRQPLERRVRGAAAARVAARRAVEQKVAHARPHRAVAGGVTTAAKPAHHAQVHRAVDVVVVDDAAHALLHQRAAVALERDRHPHDGRVARRHRHRFNGHVGERPRGRAAVVHRQAEGGGAEVEGGLERQRRRQREPRAVGRLAHHDREAVGRPTTRTTRTGPVAAQRVGVRSHHAAAHVDGPSAAHRLHRANVDAPHEVEARQLQGARVGRAQRLAEEQYRAEAHHGRRRAGAAAQLERRE